MATFTYADRAKRHPQGTELQYRFLDNDTVDLVAMLGPDHGSDVLAQLEFQAGPIPEHGVNGVTNELLLEVLIERTKRLDAMFPCDENKQAIECMGHALNRFNERTARRRSAGIEGKHEEQGA